MYDLDRIEFPVDYRLAEPSSVSFTPLGMQERLTLGQILERHPKGIAYGGIVKGLPVYPVLTDRAEKVLSFPPIINSTEIGEVKTTTRNILVEVTGTDLRMTALTLTILAANLHDRGARIEPVRVQYPYDTEFGRGVLFPVDTSGRMKLPLSRFMRALGEDISFTELKKRLSAYGHTVAGTPRTAINVKVRKVDLIGDFILGFDRRRADDRPKRISRARGREPRPPPRVGRSIE
jgi:phenylalanyl-tRNA synthetase beta chain